MGMGTVRAMARVSTDTVAVSDTVAMAMDDMGATDMAAALVTDSDIPTMAMDMADSVMASAEGCFRRCFRRCFCHLTLSWVRFVGGRSVDALGEPAMLILGIGTHII